MATIEQTCVDRFNKKKFECLKLHSHSACFFQCVLICTWVSWDAQLRDIVKMLKTKDHHCYNINITCIIVYTLN